MFPFVLHAILNARELLHFFKQSKFYCETSIPTTTTNFEILIFHSLINLQDLFTFTIYQNSNDRFTQTRDIYNFFS